MRVQRIEPDMYFSNGDYYGRINIGDKPIREAPQTTVSRTAGLVLTVSFEPIRTDAPNSLNCSFRWPS